MNTTALEMEVRARRLSHQVMMIFFFLGALAVTSMVTAAHYAIPATFVTVFTVVFVCQVLAFLVYIIQIRRGVINAEEGSPAVKNIPSVNFLASFVAGLVFAFSILAGIFTAAFFRPPPL